MKTYKCDCICGCKLAVTGVGHPKPGTPDMLCLACWTAGIQDGDTRHAAKAALPAVHREA